MSYPINQKINPNSQMTMGLNAPQLQDINAENVAQTVTQNSALKGIARDSGDKPWLTPALMLPIGAGMIYGMGKFNNACSNVNGRKSIIDSVGEFGDKIGKKLPFIDRGIEKLEQFWNYADKNMSKRSRIWSAFFHAQTTPEFSMVKMMAGSTKAEVASEIVSKIEKYLKEGGKLNGVTQADLEKLSKISHTPEGLKEIAKICKSQNKDASILVKKFWNLKSLPGVGRLFKNDFYLSEKVPFMNKMERRIYISEFTNKINAFIEPKGKTFIGRKLPQTMIRVVESLTNGTAGGKIAIFLGAMFVADAIKRTMQAKKGEKTSTFTENLAYNSSMYLTMPLCIGIIHKFGGLQHIGMGKGKEEIEKNLTAYNKAVEEFNKKAAIGGFATKEEYKKEITKIKDMIKGDTKIVLKEGAGKTFKKSLLNIVYKPLKVFGDMLTVGIGNFRPYLSKGESTLVKAFNLIKQIPYYLKKGTGYPVRMLTFIMVLSPFFAKFFAKGSHLVFGKPSKSVVDDYEDHSEKPLPQLIYPPQQSSVETETPQSTMQAVQQNNLAYNQAENSKEMMNSNSLNPRTMIPTEPKEQTKRRYVPSSQGVKITSVDPKEEKARMILQESKKSEKIANKYID